VTKKNAAAVSVGSNAVLTAAKLIVGLACGSVSVISEAAHSAIDLLASVIAYFAVTAAEKPADADHRFGHGKFENISGFAEALLIFLAAAWIIREAIGKFLHPAPVELPGLAMAVMLVSSIANWLVSSMLFRVGKREDSMALVADAWHLRTDVYTSAGVMAALAVYWTAAKTFPGYDFRWLDPAAAMAVALLIIKAAAKLTRESASGLLDESLPAEEEKQITGALISIPGLVGIKTMRTRKAGRTRFIDIEAVVGAAMSVRDSHAITELMTEKIRALFPETLVNVHVEPDDENPVP